jgi:hypothetical protein
MLSLPLAAPGANIQVQSVAAGYTTSSIELGAVFGGAIAPDPADADHLYVSSGFFGSQTILSVDAGAGTTRTVAAGFGNIGGIAVLGNGDLAITENFLSDKVLRARDLNSNGDFLDAGEVTELIAPILTDGDFTGAQLTVAPSGNASAIPAGALLVQTADGQTSSELLIVENPVSTPAFRPTGGAYYSGFQYNGGIAFDAAGNVILGIGQFDFFTFTPSGRIVALVNLNSDTDIDPGESNVLVDEPALSAGISDLAVSNENAVFFGENSGDVKTFALPANLLTGTASPALFARTDASYISAVRLDAPTRTFAPGATGSTARLLLSGYAAGFNAATNLVVIAPGALAEVQNWELY